MSTVRKSIAKMACALKKFLSKFYFLRRCELLFKNYKFISFSTGFRKVSWGGRSDVLLHSGIRPLLNEKSTFYDIHFFLTDPTMFLRRLWRQYILILRVECASNKRISLPPEFEFLFPLLFYVLLWQNAR